MENDILLEQEQEELLVTLVEAARSLPREKRQKFWAIETLGNVQAEINHPGLAEETRAPRGDIEILASQNLLLLSESRGGTLNFDVTPLGFMYYEHLKTRRGQGTDRVEQSVRKYLDSSPFQVTYPAAMAKWVAAEQRLWSSDSAAELTTVGHLCREAMQEFAATVVAHFKPPAVDPDKARTVARLRSVIAQETGRLGEAKRQLLEALVSYWGAVADLVQRQEHGAAKEREPLVWEDARRVVFQTAMVMFEVAHALARSR